MAVNVDPFIRPIPQQLMTDPEMREFFTYLMKWAHDITKRTGGGNDAIDDLYNINTYETTSTAGRLAGVYADQISGLISTTRQQAGEIAALRSEVEQLRTRSTTGSIYTKEDGVSISTVGNKYPQQDTFSISSKGA